MKKTAVFCCLLVGILGVTAAGAGFMAESTRIEETDVKLIIATSTCVYPRSPSHALGIAGSTLLLVTHLLITTITCAGYWNWRFQNPDGDKYDLKIDFIFMGILWTLFVPALVMFMMGTFYKYESQNAVLEGREYTCDVVKAGVFSTAAELTLGYLGFGMCYLSAVYFKPDNDDD